MSYTLATESGLSKPQVYNFAQSMAVQLGFVPGGDIYDLVKRMGGRVEIEDTLHTDPEHTGSLYVESPGDFRIVVPSHTSPERDRFTVAHELGHYLLHYLWPKKSNPAFPERVVAYRRGSERIEWEANWFAAAFLMPEDVFRTTYQAVNGDVGALANRFGVSRAAADVRVRGLGL